MKPTTWGLSVVIVLMGLWAPVPADAGISAANRDARTKDEAYRWDGADFAFCFISDDGTICNLGWAEKAREMDFRFTIAVNIDKQNWNYLTPDSMLALYQGGFEIANHSRTHGFAGLPTDCPRPPLGSLLGYWECDVLPEVSMPYFSAEIERDSLALRTGIPVEAIRTLAYPRHMHSKAIIDSLNAEGYIGARYGENSSYSYYSNGDFADPARNSWDGGISLFRVPVAHYTHVFFGNHCADPPVHFSYEEFVAAALPYINASRANGGIFALYSHHFGDDDDSLGDINYGSGGLTCEELGWMVDLVRANGGKVMTFGDAVAYYRERSEMVDMDGDLVWVPAISRVPDELPVRTGLSQIWPNPFNPRTTISFFNDVTCPIEVSVYDLGGKPVTTLVAETLAPGDHTAVWFGRDDQGRTLPSGTYFVRMATPRRVDTKALTLLK